MIVSSKEPAIRVTNQQRLFGLQTMINWICIRHSLLLSDWLFRILKKLHTLNKNSVLIEVAHLTIEKVHKMTDRIRFYSKLCAAMPTKLAGLRCFFIYLHNYHRSLLHYFNRHPFLSFKMDTRN